MTDECTSTLLSQLHLGIKHLAQCFNSKYLVRNPQKTGLFLMHCIFLLRTNVRKASEWFKCNRSIYLKCDMLSVSFVSLSAIPSKFIHLVVLDTRHLVSVFVHFIQQYDVIEWCCHGEETCHQRGYRNKNGCVLP